MAEWLIALAYYRKGDNALISGGAPRAEECPQIRWGRRL